MAETPKNPNIKYGLISPEELPMYYTKANAAAAQTYAECLEQSRELLNPNYDVLFSINGLDVNDNFTFMGSLKRPFPDDELAKNLRKSQANKWAFRAVAEGIERFKRGMHMEAFQCLNKALTIDPSNVEGLVARGALYANRGSFQKAVDDFKTALEINQYHNNARKYMGETLVALGRSLEEDKRYEEAQKAYTDCLEIIPQHPQALECLEKLNQSTGIGTGSGVGLLDNELLEQLINLAAPTTSAAAAQALTNEDAPEKSSSEDSSSDSEDSNSDSDTASSNKFKKEPSLSPLSKRMALHSASLQAAAAPKPLNTAAIQYDQPFYFNLAQPGAVANNGNDFKLEDDDTETRVRKLLEEASQHKKAKKNKKQKKIKKAKKTNETEKSDIKELSGSLFQNNYLQQAFKSVGSSNIEQKLDEDISSYAEKIADIKNRQAKLRDSLAGPLAASKEAAKKIDRALNIAVDDDDDSPPPPPPFVQLPNAVPFSTSSLDLKKSEPSSSSSINFSLGSTKQQRTYGRQSTNSSSTHSTERETQKLSFQIRKPVKTDIIGMVRIATPLAQRSRSRTRSPLKRHYRSRSRNNRSRSRDRKSRSRDRRSRSRNRKSRSRSRSRSRRRRRRSSRSRTRSRSRSRRHRRSRSRSHSRSKSYARRHSHSRSRSRDSRRRTSRRSPSYTDSQPSTSSFGNRIWTRDGYRPPGSSSSFDVAGNGRWLHDKFEFINEQPAAKSTNEDDGPTIEEIDEIINQAQKDRKAEIIKRDKDILKKPFKGRF